CCARCAKTEADSVTCHSRCTWRRALARKARNTMSEQWLYARDGKQAGPVSAAALKELAGTGQLSPTDFVWKQGMREWIAAEKIKDLFASLPTSAPRSSSYGRDSLESRLGDDESAL